VPIDPDAPYTRIRCPARRAGPPECAERGERAVADRRGVLETRRGRLVRDEAVFGYPDELRVRAERRDEAEDLVADREAGDGCPDGFDGSGQLAAEDPLAGPAKSGDQPPHGGVRGAPMAVCPVDGRGPDPDEDLVCVGDRVLDVLEAQDVRWAVPVVDNRSHRSPPWAPGRRDSGPGVRSSV
jgi:hypothetical protein